MTRSTGESIFEDSIGDQRVSNQTGIILSSRLPGGKYKSLTTRLPLGLLSGLLSMGNPFDIELRGNMRLLKYRGRVGNGGN